MSSDAGIGQNCRGHRSSSIRAESLAVGVARPATRHEPTDNIIERPDTTGTNPAAANLPTGKTNRGSKHYFKDTLKRILLKTDRPGRLTAKRIIATMKRIAKNKGFARPEAKSPETQRIEPKAKPKPATLTAEEVKAAIQRNRITRPSTTYYSDLVRKERQPPVGPKRLVSWCTCPGHLPCKCGKRDRLRMRSLKRSGNDPWYNGPVDQPDYKDPEWEAKDIWYRLKILKRLKRAIRGEHKGTKEKQKKAEKPKKIKAAEQQLIRDLNIIRQSCV